MSQGKDFAMASSTQKYSVRITNGVTGAAPADGFIDPKRLEVEAYNQTPTGLTLALCQAKRRGNLRWAEIFNQIGLVTNCYLSHSSIVSDATFKTEPTSVSFVLFVEHGDDWLVTQDELTPGAVLTGVACLKRCIARGLATPLNRQIDIYDPTPVAGAWGGGTTSVPRTGSRINPASGFTIAPYATISSAEGMITVTKT
jgi:hypothetical protein